MLWLGTIQLFCNKLVQITFRISYLGITSYPTKMIQSIWIIRLAVLLLAFRVSRGLRQCGSLPIKLFWYKSQAYIFYNLIANIECSCRYCDCDQNKVLYLIVIMKLVIDIGSFFWNALLKYTTSWRPLVNIWWILKIHFLKSCSSIQCLFLRWFRS